MRLGVDMYALVLEVLVALRLPLTVVEMCVLMPLALVLRVLQQSLAPVQARALAVLLALLVLSVLPMLLVLLSRPVLLPVQLALLEPL